LENEQIVQSSKIIDVDIEREMKKSFLDYSMSVIVSRALPDVRDGLKPVHRRILYSQYEDNLTPDKPYKKCATTVGNVLGRYHPHGDSSVYDALVRLAQDFSMRYTLVDGHGNFGSVDGDPPAAYRYTESKMSKISVEMLTDIDKETVDFIPNYDDSRKEPSVLPSRFPNLLVNGSTGIAVGMATNIPPHNLGEVIDAVNYVIDNPDASLDDIMKYIKGPDFPTAGIIMGQSGIKAAYGTGRGKITVRAKAEIADDKNGKSKIIVTELPYQVNKARLVEAIADMVKDKRIEGISNIDDHSDRNGMHIEISLKREASPNVVLNSLYRNSQMQITYGIIMLAIVNGEPKILTLKDILRNYIDFQVDVITRRTIFDLRKAEERAHILEGLKIAIDFIDEVIRIIRSSKDQPTARHALSERFGLDDAQTQAIVSMRLGQLSGLEREKIEEELTALINKIADFKDILSNGERLLGIIKTELNAIRSKFSDERRTQIESVSGEVDIEDLIPYDDCVITMTNLGYVKRQKVDNYRTQRRGGRGISGMNRRSEDFATDMFVSGTHDYVLFFSNLGRVYKMKCYMIPEGSRTSKGMNINNLLPLSANEKITSMIRMPEEGDEGMYLVMITKNGIIKRIATSEFHTNRKGGLNAISLDENDELVWVRLTDGNAQLLIATQNGMALRLNETQIRPTGRTSRGVKAIRLKEGDCVIGMSILREGSYVLTVSENGYGRLSKQSDYRIQSRGGKGLHNYPISKYGKVAAIKAVDLDDDIIIISDNGVIIRINASTISINSRVSRGVKLMKMDGSSKVATISRAPHEEESYNDNDDDDSQSGEQFFAESPIESQTIIE
jgi:DNA gyrase subunit A